MSFVAVVVVAAAVVVPTLFSLSFVCVVLVFVRACVYVCVCV